MVGRAFILQPISDDRFPNIEIFINKKAVRKMDSLYSWIQNLCFPFGAVEHLQHALHLHGHWHHWERKFVVHV